MLGRARSPVLRRGRHNHTQERATQERTRIEYVLLSEETWPELIAKGELGVVGLTMSTQRLELLGGTPTFRRDGPDSFGFGGNGHIRDPRRCAVLRRAQRQAADLTQTSDQNAGGGDVRVLYAVCARTATVL